MIAISDFLYDLPDNRIADFPLPERDASRVAVFKNEMISEIIFSQLPNLIPADSLVIFNNTRVMKARLLFLNSGGQAIELFCLEPDTDQGEISQAMSKPASVHWRCLVGKVSRWKPGVLLSKTITSGAAEIHLQAELISREQDFFVVAFSWTPSGLSFGEVLQEAGDIPLPPYIKRKPEESDAERYQTVYARTGGSVAAPTAGLHFTDDILDRLTEKNISRDFVTLHVGAGTFKPVKSTLIGDHPMHAEFIDFSRETIEQLHRFSGGTVTVVGTTSLRALESLYWIGVKLLTGKDQQNGELFIEQWYPYQDHPEISPAASLEAVLAWMTHTGSNRLFAKTSLLIAPGYRINIPRILITNFHQPGSTLLLLVAAFIGEKWKEVYRYALDHDFRFLSYGDACLLFRP